jgi:ketosteroid isomerase-like protein
VSGGQNAPIRRAGGRVLVEAIVTTRGKSSEVALSEPRWVVMTIREGKVTRTETYASRADALAASGAEG